MSNFDSSRREWPALRAEALSAYLVGKTLSATRSNPVS